MPASLCRVHVDTDVARHPELSPDPQGELR